MTWQQPKGDRRQFLKCLACAGVAGTTAEARARSPLAPTGSHNDEYTGEHTGEHTGEGHSSAPANPLGVLVDLSMCVGCRLCEHACKQASGIEPGDLKSYDDQSVFRVTRRPAPDSFTVLNSFDDAAHPDKPVYAKLNCMHCNHPACVSACIVGALQKRENGAVTYDAWKCIGCRYCMVACPFQLPAYDYHLALTPQVRKCQFCFEKISNGEKPACVDACPREALTFGKREALVALAHEKIEKRPDQYIDHVYGEHEIGGTSWMYVSHVPFDQAGFVTLGTTPPPQLTEKIQHGVFKYWVAPVGWYAFLATMFWFTGRRERLQHRATKTTCIPVNRETAAAAETGTQPVSCRHYDEPAHAAPLKHKLLTRGVLFLLSLVIIGAGAFVWRMSIGLGATTNLTQQRPWGLWIAMDVGSGIALAGGGFVACAIFHVFHRHRYYLLSRSALVCALLGYTFYVPGLLADLGKWWKLPITMLPTCWQGNSVLFEVGMCVMIYLNVQYAELTPIICQRLLGENWFKRWPRLYRLTQFIERVFNKIMPALLCLGVCLSTFHQSSLGNLLVIAPYKLHHLWWSPLAPLHFLLSAMMVGLPMVIFTILFASWSLDREPEMETLTPLARKYAAPLIAIYLAAKVGDMMWRGTWSYLLDGSYEGWLWIAEMLLIVVPFAMLFIPRVTNSPKLLSRACLAIILGVVLNRLNVFVLAFHPPFETKPYIPSAVEFAVSIGLIAGLMLVYRIAVTYLPILEPRPKAQVAV